MSSRSSPARLTGLLRDVAISYQFGTGRELDAYLAAIRLPDLVFQVAAGGAVAAAFIPIYSGYLVVGRLAEARRLLSAIFNLVIAGLIPVLVVVWIAAPSLIALIAPGFEPEVNDLSWRLARILIVSPLLFTLGCFVTSALNAHRRFAAGGGGADRLQSRLDLWGPWSFPAGWASTAWLGARCSARSFTWPSRRRALSGSAPGSTLASVSRTRVSSSYSS